MLVQDVMTRNVVTVSKGTSIGEAQRIMKEHNFRRLPVVHRSKLVGLVTEPRLERVKPRTTAPLLWQITYLLSHTTVGDVMRKRVVTVKPTDSVELAVAKAQEAKVGTLVVLEEGKIVGICTTNDFFYKIVNPTLGLGESGSRVFIAGGGGGKSAQEIIAKVNQMGIETKVLWAIPSPEGGKDLTLHLEIEDASHVIEEIKKLGYEASTVIRSSAKKK